MEHSSTLPHYFPMTANPTIDNVAVGRRLEALRIATGLQKGPFADSVTIDASSYSKIIKGQKPFTSEMAFRAAERWGVSMDFFYRGSLDKIPSTWLASIMESLNKRAL